MSNRNSVSIASQGFLSTEEFCKADYWEQKLPLAFAMPLDLFVSKSSFYFNSFNSLIFIVKPTSFFHKKTLPNKKFMCLMGSWMVF